MPEIRVYRAAEFPPVLEWQVRDFVRIVWTDSNVDDPSVMLGDMTRDPMNFVVVDGDMMISHAQVTAFTIDHDGETYRVAGVGGVMTYPNFRKGGYATQVVVAATQHIAGSGVDFGMLFTGPDNFNFYTRNGWTVIPGIKILKGDKNNPVADGENTLLYPVTPRGHQAVKVFENASVYIGPHGW